MSVVPSAIELEDSVWQAVVAKDGDALASLFSDDYIEVTADGKRVMKDSIVDLSPKVDEIISYEIRHTTTIDMGANATLLSYHLVLHGQLRGEPIEPPHRWVVSVWRRTDDTWQCCFFQQTAADS